MGIFRTVFSGIFTFLSSHRNFFNKHSSSVSLKPFFNGILQLIPIKYMFAGSLRYFILSEVLWPGVLVTECYLNTMLLPFPSLHLRVTIEELLLYFSSVFLVKAHFDNFKASVMSVLISHRPYHHVELPALGWFTRVWFLWKAVVSDLWP
jgi:hypothetical protein